MFAKLSLLTFALCVVVGDGRKTIRGSHFPTIPQVAEPNEATGGFKAQEIAVEARAAKKTKNQEQALLSRERRAGELQETATSPVASHGATSHVAASHVAASHVTTSHASETLHKETQHEKCKRAAVAWSEAGGCPLLETHKKLVHDSASDAKKIEVLDAMRAHAESLSPEFHGMAHTCMKETAAGCGTDPEETARMDEVLNQFESMSGHKV